jgi:hypothetical protein
LCEEKKEKGRKIEMKRALLSQNVARNRDKKRFLRYYYA